MIEKPGEPKKQEDASAKLRFVWKLLFQRFNFSLIYFIRIHELILIRVSFNAESFSTLDQKH